MLRTILCFLQEKPYIGLKGTIGSLAAGSTPTIFHIPREEIIFWFQVIAFAVTIIAGILTAYATSQKIKKNKSQVK